MRIRNVLRTALAGMALALGASTGPVQAQSSSAPGSDGSTGTVTVNPIGAPPPTSVTTTLNLNDPSGVGPAPNGTLDFGAQNGNGGGGGAHTGPPVGCVPTGIILTGSIPIPGFGIVSGPPKTGVVGIPTWFWTSPYSGGVVPQQPVAGYYITCPMEQVVGAAPGVEQPTVQINDVTLWADIWPETFEWDWGDGSPPLTGTCSDGTTPRACTLQALGSQDSAQVTHTYQDSSSGQAKGYTVKLTIEFAGRLGQPPNDFYPLAPFTQQASVDLPVQEIQSILVPVPSATN